jgi:hypothetical protein
LSTKAWVIVSLQVLIPYPSLDANRRWPVFSLWQRGSRHLSLLLCLMPVGLIIWIFVGAGTWRLRLLCRPWRRTVRYLVFIVGFTLTWGSWVEILIFVIIHFHWLERSQPNYISIRMKSARTSLHKSSPDWLLSLRLRAKWVLMTFPDWWSWKWDGDGLGNLQGSKWGISIIPFLE